MSLLLMGRALIRGCGCIDAGEKEPVLLCPQGHPHLLLSSFHSRAEHRPGPGRPEPGWRPRTSHSACGRALRPLSVVPAAGCRGEHEYPHTVCPLNRFVSGPLPPISLSPIFQYYSLKKGVQRKYKTLVNVHFR